MQTRVEPARQSSNENPDRLRRTLLLQWGRAAARAREPRPLTQTGDADAETLQRLNAVPGHRLVPDVDGPIKLC